MFSRRRNALPAVEDEEGQSMKRHSSSQFVTVGHNLFLSAPLSVELERTISVHNRKMQEKQSVPIKGEEVLLIDDDVELCGMLRNYLGRHGWTVHAVHTGNAGIEAAKRYGADLIVLDVMLPDINGFEVLRRLQREMDVRVLLLTARGEEVDRIVGLEMGADDYIAKPFSPRELLARMRAVVRRSTPRDQQEIDLRFKAGDFIVDFSTREIAFANKPLDLTGIEFSLLRLLLSRPHEVLSREELMKQVFERPFRPFDRSLDMHVLRLRRKMGALHGFHGAIKTVRSGGYMLVLDPLMLEAES
jgi:two-component system response regulator CpxR